MKLKLLALSCCLAAAFTAQAQTAVEDHSENKTYKPIAGDITTEVAFSFKDGISLNNGQLRIRRFMVAEKATRIGVSLYHSYNKQGDTIASSHYGVSIAPGIEKHFTGTSKLSPYVGIELPLGYSGFKDEQENFTIKGGYLNIGVNGLAGVDYYFAPRFYTGFELGLGARYSKKLNTVTTSNDSNWENELKGHHSFSLSPFSTGGIRVGFVF